MALAGQLIAASDVPPTASTAYTATLTNATLGNGSLAAEYSVAGNLTTVSFIFTLGSTSAVATSPTVSVPTAHVGTYTTYGVGRGGRAGSRWPIMLILGAGSTSINWFNLASPITSVTATVPLTWTTGDVIDGTLTYPTA